MKHTPGPWMVEIETDRDFPERMATIYDTENPGAGIIATIYAHTNQKTMSANARLIAAAPEMLEILKALMAPATMTGHGRAMQAAFDLIAKIEA